MAARRKRGRPVERTMLEPIDAYPQPHNRGLTPSRTHQPPPPRDNVPGSSQLVVGDVLDVRHHRGVCCGIDAVVMARRRL